MVSHSKNRGRSHARNSGIEKAKGEILVFIDSDTVIKPDTLTKIFNYFLKHEKEDALTGLLSKEHPNPSYFSQYKNLYMNYIFRKLPERVNFLFGSICAIRRRALMPFGPEVKLADDTALGQRLTQMGRQIAFLRDLEVVHLKDHSFFSLLKNDFQIPFDWAKIFIQHKGWRQLGRNQTGYLHSPKEQLLSVVIAPTIVLSSLALLFGLSLPPFALPLALIWIFLNLHFFIFLTKEKGLLFGAASVLTTFFDNLAMALGIFCGLVRAF